MATHHTSAARRDVPVARASAPASVIATRFRRVPVRRTSTLHPPEILNVSRVADAPARREHPDPAPSPIVALLCLTLGILMVASLWRIFQRAGEPGWAVLVPIYHGVVLLRIAQRPLWWLLLLLIPFVNVGIVIAIYVAVAHRFGRSTAFGVGLGLVPFVFLPLLAFGAHVNRPPVGVTA